MRFLLALTLSFFLAVIFTGCESASNTGQNSGNSRLNSNASNAYSASNAVNNAVNTMTNVANAVSNAVERVTGNTDEDFLKNTALGGMTEIEASKLAAKSTNAEIKKFAQTMISDHTKAANELKALAKKKNIEVAAELDSSHKSAITTLQGKSGADFDKAYVDQMVSDHESTVKAFQDKATNAKDADIKAWAAKTLPTLQKHLDEIKVIQAKMK